MNDISQISMWPDFPKGLRVLLLDGELKSRQTAEKLLKSCCYSVTCCANCAEAVAFLKNPANVFDVLLADLRVISQKTADNVRLLEATHDLPILLMSESATPEEVLQGIKLGAEDFLEKPLSPLKIRNIWQHVVRKQMKVRVDSTDCLKALPCAEACSPALSDAADCSASGVAQGSCMAAEPKFAMEAEALSPASAGADTQEHASLAPVDPHTSTGQPFIKPEPGLNTSNAPKASSVVGLPVSWMASPMLAVRPPCFMPPFMMGGPPMMWPVPPFMARPPVMPSMTLPSTGVMPGFSPVPVPGFMQPGMGFQMPAAHVNAVAHNPEPADPISPSQQGSTAPSTSAAPSAAEAVQVMSSPLVCAPATPVCVPATNTPPSNSCTGTAQASSQSVGTAVLPSLVLVEPAISQPQVVDVQKSHSAGSPPALVDSTECLTSTVLPAFDQSLSSSPCASNMVEALDVALSASPLKRSESHSSIGRAADSSCNLHSSDCGITGLVLDDHNAVTFTAPLGLALKKSDSLVNFINECLHSSISSSAG